MLYQLQEQWTSAETTEEYGRSSQLHCTIQAEFCGKTHGCTDGEGALKTYLILTATDLNNGFKLPSAVEAVRGPAEFNNCFLLFFLQLRLLGDQIIWVDYLL